MNSMKKIFQNVLVDIFLLLRGPITIFVATVGSLLYRPSGPRIIVLCYHSVSDDTWRFSIPFASLQKQIEWVLKRYIPITTSDLTQYLSGKKKLEHDSFVVTFDDGYSDNLLTKDFFKSKNIRPTIFVLSDSEHANRVEIENEKSLLTLGEIQELYKNGWEIGSHSATHANLYSTVDLKQDVEIVQSKEILRDALGVPILYFAYPKGLYTTTSTDKVRQAGYELAYAISGNYAKPNQFPYLVDRIGIDRTHGFLEFKAMFSPVVVALRTRITRMLSSSPSAVHNLQSV